MLYEIQYWDYNYATKKWVLWCDLYNDYRSMLMFKNYIDESKDLIFRKILIL